MSNVISQVWRASAALGSAQKFKRNVGTILLLMLSMLSSLAAREVAHPFYVSICTIEHNAKAKTLELTFKFNTEDLEAALETQTKERLRLGSPQESPAAAQYIFAYLKRAFTLQVEGDTLAFVYVGKEVELDEVWCYVEVAHVATVHKLTVRNSALMEKFEAQQNIVHVKVEGKQKSLVLWKDKREGSVEF